MLVIRTASGRPIMIGRKNYNPLAIHAWKVAFNRCLIYTHQAFLDGNSETTRKYFMDQYFRSIVFFLPSAIFGVCERVLPRSPSGFPWLSAVTGAGHTFCPTRLSGTDHVKLTLATSINGDLWDLFEN